MVCWALSTQKISGARPDKPTEALMALSGRLGEEFRVCSHAFCQTYVSEDGYALFDLGYHDLFLGVSWPAKRITKVYHQIIAWLSSCPGHPLHHR
jgi:hypothetical protein